MSGVITATKEIPAQGHFVQTNDSTLKAWLDKLVAATGGFTSDLVSCTESELLWAARLLNTDADTATYAGSAYVVSAEAFKRIQARRY